MGPTPHLYIPCSDVCDLLRMVVHLFLIIGEVYMASQSFKRFTTIIITEIQIEVLGLSSLLSFCESCVFYP